MAELIAYFLLWALLTGLLVFFTPLLWWVAALLALIVVLFGVWVGPELF